MSDSVGTSQHLAFTICEWGYDSWLTGAERTWVLNGEYLSPHTSRRGHLLGSALLTQHLTKKSILSLENRLEHTKLCDGWYPGRWHLRHCAEHRDERQFSL